MSWSQVNQDIYISRDPSEEGKLHTVVIAFGRPHYCKTSLTWPLGWSNPTPTGFLLSMPHLNTRKRLSAFTLIAKQEAMLIIIRHSKDKEGRLWTFFLEIPHCKFLFGGCFLASTFPSSNRSSLWPFHSM